MIERYVYQKVLVKKNKIGDLGKTAGLKKTFPKSDITSWSDKVKNLQKLLKIQSRIII